MRIPLMAIALAYGASAAYSAELAKFGVSELNGWCMPASACTGEPEPIKNGVFNTCEDQCTFSRPSPVKRMNAVVFDVDCESDGGPTAYRAFVAKHPEGIVVVDQNGATELVRCK